MCCISNITEPYTKSKYPVHTLQHPAQTVQNSDCPLPYGLLTVVVSDTFSYLLLPPPPGDKIASCLASFPTLLLEAQLHPITRTVLRIALSITPDFEWKVSWLGWGLEELLAADVRV